jgi:guanine deaminase
MKSDHEKFMRMAIGRAEAGDAPFGAVMVQNGQVVASAFNTVKTDRDPTAHAEIKLVRATVKELGLMNLETCTLYTTVEPCPMCMAAAMFAGVGRVVYGASIDEVKEYRPQIELSCREVAARGFRKIEVIGGVLSDLCLVPFRVAGS